MKLPCSRCHALGALSLALFLAGCHSRQHSDAKAPQKVTVVSLKTQPYTQTISLPGRTTSYLTSPVTPQVTGIIQQRLFKEGGEVTAGQILYQIDPTPYQAVYDADKANLAKDQAALISARPIAARNRSLASIDAVSQETLETSEATLKQDEAAIQADQAALESARINLNYTHVRAPISGTISASAYTPGALVTADQTTPLATIYAYDPMYVDVTQSSAQMLTLRQKLANGTLHKDISGGAEAKLILEDGSTYALEGSLQFAGVGVDESTGTITLRAIFPNPEKLLLPGMYVQATLVQGILTQALMVPQQAVTHDQRGNATALIVDAQNKIEQRTLMLAGTSGANWVVTSGLKEGDRVVLSGSQYASPGDTVRAVEASPTAPSASSNFTSAQSSSSSSSAQQ